MKSIIGNFVFRNYIVSSELVSETITVKEKKYVASLKVIINVDNNQVTFSISINGIEYAILPNLEAARMIWNRLDEYIKAGDLETISLDAKMM